MLSNLAESARIYYVIDRLVCWDRVLLPNNLDAVVVFGVERKLGLVHIYVLNRLMHTPDASIVRFCNILSGCLHVRHMEARETL